jgi:hypothetical protein
MSPFEQGDGGDVRSMGPTQYKGGGVTAQWAQQIVAAIR